MGQSYQGEHLSGNDGKPGNVEEFHRLDRIVRDFSKSRKIAGEKNLVRENCLKHSEACVERFFSITHLVLCALLPTFYSVYC